MGPRVPLALAVLAMLGVPVRAEHDSFLVETGTTRLTVTTTTSAVLNDYAQVTAAVNAGATTIPVGNASVSSPTGFAAGRLVMLLIQNPGRRLRRRAGARHHQRPGERGLRE